MINLNSQINNLAQIFIGGLISLACIYASIYFNKAIQAAQEKAKQIKDEGTRKIVENALGDADKLINTNITSAENSLKPAILKAIADGKVDKTELNSLNQIVKENVLNQLGSQTKDVLNKNLGDLSSYIENRIENNLAELKLQEGNSINKTVIPEPSNETKVENTPAEDKAPIEEIQTSPADSPTKDQNTNQQNIDGPQYLTSKSV